MVELPAKYLNIMNRAKQLLLSILASHTCTAPILLSFQQPKNSPIVILSYFKSLVFSLFALKLPANRMFAAQSFAAQECDARMLN